MPMGLSREKFALYCSTRVLSWFHVTSRGKPELRASLLDPNVEIERRGDAAPTNEADLSRSSTISLTHRDPDPAITRSLGTACAYVSTDIY